MVCSFGLLLKIYWDTGTFIFVATLRDVAKRASVSVSTASRILSNSTKEKYAEETQLNVLRASLELGYRANFAARALVSGQTGIIATVFPHIYDSPFTALASLQILSGIEAYCSDNGYHVLLSSPRIVDGEVDASFINMLASGYPDGIIIDSHFRIDPIMAVLHKFQLPMIVLGYGQHPYRLLCDNVLGGRMLMRHILELGHRCIGLIAIPDGVSPAADSRIAGMRAEADAYGLDFDAFPRFNGTYSSESGASGAAALLSQHPDLSVLVALNDRMAMGAIRQLRKQGYNVPDHISVIGYDDLPQSSEFTPALTSINQQLSRWGELAMNMLLKVMSGEDPDPIVLEPRLMVRKSTAPPMMKAGDLLEQVI